MSTGKRSEERPSVLGPQALVAELRRRADQNRPDPAPRRIRTVQCRKILNSHGGFTDEFIVQLDDGAVGVGSSPEGETISMYEAAGPCRGGEQMLRALSNDGMLEAPLTQERLDDYLQSRLNVLGRNACWAFSSAFHGALEPPGAQVSAGPDNGRALPRLCMNILNGGSHAYTNPVLSDFPEFLVIPKHQDFFQALHDHAVIQQKVREGLNARETTMVNGNRVFCFPTRDNRECLDFLLSVLAAAGCADSYLLMIDASAGDLCRDRRYTFSITDGRVYTTDGLTRFWQDLLREYPLGFLEDPFMERDFEGWMQLTKSAGSCRVIGDNLYCSDACRITEGSRNGYTHGAIIKPNQAGTVTAVRAAINACLQLGQIPITSHRSISTESTFLSAITMAYGVPLMKIGPLFSDYSSILRLNELLRIAGDHHGVVMVGNHREAW